MTDPSKPPYRVPSMDEIRAIPWNGYTVASTFSGGGGSSTGYRMAGYRVLWANEFVPAAIESYRANMADYTTLDGRDIRTIRPEEILKATGLAEGELDLFDGSPPCDSFSTAGKREAGWGEERDHQGKKQRTDDLFYEYARLLRGLKPKTFVAENVSGLVKGTAKGYFLRILADLKSCGYRVEAKMLDAQWMGVPQARQRIIFVGVRNDLGLAPAFPKPLAYRYSVRDAIPELAIRRMVVGNDAFESVWGSPNVPSPTIMASGGKTSGMVEAPQMLPPSRARAYDGKDVAFSFTKCDPGLPAPTITTGSPGNDLGHPTERRKFTIAELKRITSFPDDYVLKGTYAEQWARCGMCVPPVMMRGIAEAIRDGILAKATQTP